MGHEYSRDITVFWSRQTSSGLITEKKGIKEMRIYFETKKHCWSFSVNKLFRRIVRGLFTGLVIYGIVALFEGCLLMGFKILEYAGL
jgi:hypothetical protein